MRHLMQLADDVRRWAEREEAVRALLWYGTFALGQAGPHSDVDAAVIHRGGVHDAVASLRTSLGPRVREAAVVASRGEAALWIDDSLTKIDLRLASDPDDLNSMATSPDVPAPRLVVVLDKDGVCGPLAAAGAVRHARDVDALVDEEIEKFLVSFEAASNAHRRSDGYRFYFEHNLALHRLARLIEIAHGGDVYLFLPRMLLSTRMTLGEQEAFRSLHGQLYLPEAAALKRLLAERFLATVGELARRFDLRRDPAAIRRFLDAVLERDLFFNVRDFADAFDGRVRHGVLFRASTLSRWSGTPELDAWLSAKRVRRVVDFRDPDEAATKHPYLPELAQRLDVRVLPLSERPTSSDSPSGRSVGNGYYGNLEEFTSNVVAALRAVSEPIDGAVAVHCYAGKDRTGWFCAVVGLLLGLDEELVVDDFLRSGQDTKESGIRDFLARVADGGGPRVLLSADGFTDADVAALRHRLLDNATTGS